jgi:hypothetical protein
MTLCISFDALGTLINGEEFRKVDIKVLLCPDDLVVRKIEGCVRLPDLSKTQSSRKAYEVRPD